MVTQNFPSQLAVPAEDGSYKHIVSYVNYMVKYVSMCVWVFVYMGYGKENGFLRLNLLFICILLFSVPFLSFSALHTCLSPFFNTFLILYPIN